MTTRHETDATTAKLLCHADGTALVRTSEGYRWPNRGRPCGMTPLRVTGRDRQRAFARGFMAAAASHDPRVRARQARAAGMGEGTPEDLALVEPINDADMFTA